MTFAHPGLLWLLLVIPPGLLLFFWWSWQKRRQLLSRFIAARLLPALTIGVSQRRQKIRLLCVLLAVVCFIVALARPRWGFDWEEVKQRGLDIVVAIDTSKSMLAEDIPPNRLARAKLAALDLMQQAKSDRLALVAFAGGAFLQCPMTIDDAAFRQSIEALDVNIIPQGGTALAEAITTAATAFKEDDNYKILVLFTDGEDQDLNATQAAAKAAESGLRIFTIGIGTPEGELLRVKDGKGRTDYLRDEQGNVVKSHLNETILQQIAGAAGGFYLPLRGAKTIDTLYEKGLAPLPKSDAQEKLVKRYRERFHWPLAIGIVLLFIEILLPERARTSPAPRESIGARAGVRPRTGLLLLLLVLLAGPGTAGASSSSALRDYNAGKYERALREYRKLLENKKDPRLQFNAGAAAYRSEDYEEALKRFSEALGSPDLKLQQQAYYNRGNVLYQMGEKNADSAKRTEVWEKSLQDYQSTLKLDPQDTDAKFNYEFVKKRLEELKQQQQQSQQQNKDKKDDEKKDDQQQQQQDQQQQQQDQQQADNNQKQGQQQPKDQNDKSQQQQNSEQQKEQEKQQQNEQQQANQSEQQKQQDQQQQQQQQAQNSGKEGEDKSDDKETRAQSYAPGQMTPQQAQQLLEAQKGEEKLFPVRPVGKAPDRSRPLKDW